MDLLVGTIEQTRLSCQDTSWKRVATSIPTSADQACSCPAVVHLFLQNFQSTSPVIFVLNGRLGDGLSLQLFQLAIKAEAYA